MKCAKDFNILIACEESQVVCSEFRALGFTAYSCDILPTSGDHAEWHLKNDVLCLLDGLGSPVKKWDAIIAFPPCTYLCSSGMHWTTRGLRDSALTEQAKDFVFSIWDANCSHIAIENPIGALSKSIRKPDQIVQPWFFGDDASKQTCLWLKGFPKLEHTVIIPPKNFKLVVCASDLPLCPCCDEPWCSDHGEHYSDCECVGPHEEGIRIVTVNGYDFACKDTFLGKPVWSNQTPSGQNKLGPSKERAALRAKTYSGIAREMAHQWGGYLLSNESGVNV